MRRRWIWPVLGLIGVALFLLLSPVANPEAQVDLNVTREQSLELSRAFLVSHGFDLTGYDSAVSFTDDENALVYLQRNYSLTDANQLSREYKIWRWSVRWFKPGNEVEYTVTVDTAGPKVLGFSRKYPEQAPGARLSEAQAFQKAGQLLTDNGYQVQNWKLVGSRSKEQENRLDYHFEWQKIGVAVGAAYPKVEVDIQGDQPGLLRSYLLIPEQFQREYAGVASEGDTLALVSLFFLLLLWGLAVVWSVILARRAAWGMGLWIALLLALFSLAGGINELSLHKTAFPTNVPILVSYGLALLEVLGVAIYYVAMTMFPAAAGEGLLLAMGRDGAPYFGRARQGGLLTPGFSRSAFRGLCLAGIMLGYDTLFYYIGRKYLGVWSPASPRYSDILATPAPWLYPLTIGLMAAFSEEFTFRLFGVALAKKWLRWTPAALFVPAVIWAFAHSNYRVFPVWTRGVELTGMGILLSWAFWRYDIETTVIAHYTYDAFLVGWPLLLSGNNYYVLSGAAVTLLALVPALLGWAGSRRREEAPLFDGAKIAATALPAEADGELAPPGAPVAAAASAAVEAPAADHFAPWLDRRIAAVRSHSRTWLLLGVAGLLLALASGSRISPSLAPEYKIDEPQAEAIARTYLQDRGYDLVGYKIARQMELEPYLSYVRQVAPADVAAITREYSGVRWAVRFFKPMEPVEYRVEVDIRTGRVAAFSRSIPAESPGERLSQAEARQVAEQFLAQQGASAEQGSSAQPGASSPPLTLSDFSRLSRDHREDYQFIWESTDPRLPETHIRQEVLIQGGAVGQYYSRYVHVPESWQRSQEARTVWNTLGLALLGLMGLAGVVMALIYLIHRQVRWQSAVVLALTAALLALPAVAASWPATGMSYNTQTVWPLFLVTQATSLLVSPLIVGAGVAGAYILGTVVARQQPAPLPMGQTALGGLAAAGLAAGVAALTHLPGLWTAVPAPTTPNISGGYLALLGLLLLPVSALIAAFLERLWLQSLLSRWLKSRLLGLIAQALVIGLVTAAFLLASDSLHPAALLESGAALVSTGLIYGFAYLVGGIRTVVVAELAGQLLQRGAPLLGAGVRSASITGLLALAAAILLPVGIWFFDNRMEGSLWQSRQL